MNSHLQGIALAVAATALTACVSQPASERATVASYCFAEPQVYDWQRLDTSNLILWVMPESTAYHIGLRENVEALWSADAVEFVDGNRDGLLCAEGWDSLLVVEPSPAADPGAQPRIREESTIYFISALDQTAIASLHESYTRTSGARVRGYAPSL